MDGAIRGLLRRPLMRRVKRPQPVFGWIAAAAIAIAVAWACAGTDAAARPAMRGASAPARTAGFMFCRVPASKCVNYEVDYSGTEVLSTRAPTPGQPFFQAGRKLYIKLKWNLEVVRNKTTNALVHKRVTVSGVVDLTLPDDQSLDCTAHYSLSAAAATAQADNTYASVVAGPKVLVWGAHIPDAVAACLDSSVSPTFVSPSFRALYDRAAAPHFTIPCKAVAKADGHVSRPFDFGPRANSAELATVGLGQMEATIRSTVAITDVTCSHGQVFG
jgi:hypothetical protein